MDEPTSVLTPQEVSRLFETLNRLANEGVSILYISHKLDEIKALCQKATILRGGKVVDSVMVADESAHSLASRMMGQELDFTAGNKSSSVGTPRLKITQLELPGEDEFGIPLRNINLQVSSGEIVGIAGVAGNGQGELLKAINGETMGNDNNCIKIDEQPCGTNGVNQRRLMGLASIPEERLGHGAVPQMTLNENSLLTSFKRLGFTNKGFINLNKCRKFCDKVIDTFNVKSNGNSSSAASLSGGNLQKFIVGREILQQPEILVVSQPTWGVDAGAAQTIHQALRELAENGAAILVISQDLDELMKISDRITAICAGALSPTFPASEVTIEQIGLMMAGAHAGDHHA